MLEIQRLAGSRGHFRERQGKLIFEIVALDRPTPAAKIERRLSPPERKPHPSLLSGCKATAKTELAKYVTKVEIPKNILLGILLAEPFRSEAVILTAFFLVAENRIGFADMF